MKRGAQRPPMDNLTLRVTLEQKRFLREQADASGLVRQLILDSSAFRAWRERKEREAKQGKK
jgi:hypothetical protein